MRRIYHTIIIWMVMAPGLQAGDFWWRPEPSEPVGRRPEPPSRPHEELRPPRHEPIMRPIISKQPSPHTGSHSAPGLLSLPSASPGEGRPGLLQREQPSQGKSSETSQVKKYLEQRNGNLQHLLKLFAGDTLETVGHARARGLETVQTLYSEGRVTSLPFSLAADFAASAESGRGVSLMPWMTFMMDGLPFVEQLSGTDAGAQALSQPVLSPQAKTGYDQARADLLSASQELLGILKTIGQTSSAVGQESVSTTAMMEQLQASAQNVIEKRNAFVAMLAAQSPEAQAVAVGDVFDSESAIAEWEKQQQISSSKPVTVFPSYKTFMKDFSFLDVKGSVNRYVGQGPEKFASVQALVTALDKLAFVLDSQNFWLSFIRPDYTKEAIKKVIKAITDEYPGTFVPSKRFVWQYCSQKRIFKPVSFFIPDIAQFLTDARTLTVEQLAQKYGHGPGFIQSLLDNAYAAAYVLQQTNQTGQSAQLTLLIKKIMLLYPTLVPTSVADLMMMQNLSLQLIFNADTAFIKMATEVQRRLSIIRQQQIQDSMTQLTSAVSNVAIQANMQQGQRNLSAAQQGTLKKSLQTVLADLDAVEKELQQVTGDEFGGNYLLPAQAEIATLTDQLVALKQTAIGVGLQLVYDDTFAKQNGRAAQLVEDLKEILSPVSSPSQFSPLWKRFFDESLSPIESLNEWLNGKKPGESSDADDLQRLAIQLATRGALEQENESDFQACIWASNKMATMESKIDCVTALLKVKSTPLFMNSYKITLKALRADLDFLYNSRRVQKCLNVISRRSFLSQKIKALGEEIAMVEKQEQADGVDEQTDTLQRDYEDRLRHAREAEKVS